MFRTNGNDQVASPSLEAIESAFEFRRGRAVVRWSESPELEPKRERARKVSWAAAMLACLQHQLLRGAHTEQIATREVPWRRLRAELEATVPRMVESLSSGMRQPYRYSSLGCAIKAAMRGFDTSGDRDLRRSLNMLNATLVFVRKEGLLAEPVAVCRGPALRVPTCPARKGPRYLKLRSI